MKQLWPYLILALLLRLVLMPLAIHPDFKAYNLAAYFIAQKGEVLTFYDHISRLPRTDPLVGIYGDGQFNYPPLAYLSHGIFNFLLGPLYPWPAFNKLIYDYDHFRGSPGSMWLLYLLKFPYLLADVMGLWLVHKIITDKNQFLASLVWLFNPINIYSAYMMGQFDIFIGVLSILAVYLISKKNYSWAGVVLGIAAGFKPIPLILLPFLPGNKVKNTLIGLGTYLAIIAPYFGSTAFKHYALLASQSDKPLYAKIMVSGSQYLPLFVVGVMLLFWWQILSKAKPSWIWLSAPLFLFFALTHFHPQWLAWLAPFLVLTWVKVPLSRWPILSILAACLVIIFSFDSSLNLGMLGFKSSFQVKDQLVSIFRGILAAGCFSTFYLLQKWES